MKSHVGIVPFKKPLMVTFPHNDILAVANETTCALATYAPYRSLIKSLEPTENYQVDFSPDGKKLVIRDACLIFDVPHNCITTIYRLLRDCIGDKKNH